MDVKIDKIITDDFEMKYFAFGEGEQPLVIIPGLSLIGVSTFAESVAVAYKELADIYRIYVIDRKENIPDEYSVFDMAEDYAAALKKLDIKDAYIFGTSQGGMISQVIAVRYPELVKKLVLGSTVSSIGDVSAVEPLKTWLHLAEEGNVHDLNLAFAENVYSEATFQRFIKAIKAMDKMVTEEDIHRFIILLKGMNGFDITDKLGEIKCPAFVIGSKKDRLFSLERMSDLAERIGAESFFYDDYGHAVYDEAPDYKAKLREFFEK